MTRIAPISFTTLALAAMVACSSVLAAQEGTATPKTVAAEPQETPTRDGKTRVLESTKSDKTATAGTTPDGAKSLADPPLSKAELAKRAAARARGEYTFDDLKFSIEKGGKFEREMLTEDIEKLDKKTIRIRGYMFPTFQQSGIEEFVLVRDNLECCFGPGAAIFDCIRVKMAKGKTASFNIRPIAVKGKFEIEEFRMPDGFLAAIYKITAEEVK